MRRTSRWPLVAAALAGCAGAEAMTLPASHNKPPVVAALPREVGLNPGETMAFEVRLGGILAGEAQLAVGDVGQFEGHRAVVVKSRAETAGAAALLKKIVDEATTVIDLDSGRPLQLDTYVVQDGKTTKATARFTDKLAEVTYTRDDDPKPHAFKLDFGQLTVD